MNISDAHDGMKTRGRCCEGQKIYSRHYGCGGVCVFVSAEVNPLPEGFYQFI